ncbi:hypothetical protein PG996_014760 [Apiospora saccharicola]|uniref:Uncharacterized protein n=1 Tax=Apiospora saccharicola TaxID=335842 RepID=A0ABR1TJ82_9PEZI
MCGDTSRQSYGGAIAILNPLERISGGLPDMDTGVSGRLVFHSARDDTLATGATFTHAENVGCCDGTTYTIGIHKSGDLTTSAFVSPFIHKFSLDGKDPDRSSTGSRTLSTSLSHPLRIEVGHEGIIGRRVTVWKQGGVSPLAEGIIGLVLAGGGGLGFRFPSSMSPGLDSGGGAGSGAELRARCACRLNAVLFLLDFQYKKSIMTMMNTAVTKTHIPKTPSWDKPFG